MIRIESRSILARAFRIVAYSLTACFLIETVPASVTAETVSKGVANTKQIIQRIKSDVHDAQQFQALQQLNARMPKANMASLVSGK